MTIGASGGSGFFLLIIIAFGFLWFVLVRPQKRRQVAAQQMLDRLSVGDEVVTAGGIYGEITGITDEDDVMVRIAPGLEVRVARRAIGGVIEKPAEPEEESAGESAHSEQDPHENSEAGSSAGEAAAARPENRPAGGGPGDPPDERATLSEP
jgi:preprotein translocase subunit YajC